MAGKGHDCHWKPITDICSLCYDEYDVIEKFETLERDHHYLLHTLGKQPQTSKLLLINNQHIEGKNPKKISIFSDLVFSPQVVLTFSLS